MSDEFEDYLHNRRMQDKFCRRLNIQEVSQAFPDEQTVAIANLTKATKHLNIYDKFYGEIQSSNANMETKYLSITFIELLKKLDPMTKLRQQLTAYLRMSKTPVTDTSTPNKPLELSLEKAKLFPIEQMFELIKPRTSSTRIQCCCPLHHEKSPSFIIYRRENKFHCFGCGEHGDAIDLYMKLNSSDIQSAIKALQ